MLSQFGGSGASGSARHAAGTGSGGGVDGTPPAYGSLMVADIDGAQPMRLIRPPRNVPQAPPPDPGMQPQRFTRERNQQQDLRLCVADIPGATAALSDRRAGAGQRQLGPLEAASSLQWSPIFGQQPAPAPKFVRDNLDVSDIHGAKAEPSARTARGLPSTMDAADIEGSRPGWRPRTLFTAQPRDPLRVADICQREPGPKQKHAQLAGNSGGGGDGSRDHGLVPAAPAGAWQQPGSRQQHVPEFGVAYSVDWHKQRLGAKVEQAQEARQARQVAEAAIAAAAAAAAAKAGSNSSPPAGLAAISGGAQAGTAELARMMQRFKSHDRERSGRVQAREFAAALQHSGLGLAQQDIQQLVASMSDAHSSVEYRPFISKLWGKMQGASAVGSGGSTAGSPSGAPAAPVVAAAAHSSNSAGASSHPVAQQHVPHFVAARQRRLQTNVALALGQQPEATAREAADVAGLPGFLPWKAPPSKPFGKRMDFVRPQEHPEHYSFSGSDPRAAELRLPPSCLLAECRTSSLPMRLPALRAAQQWRASTDPMADPMAGWAMRRQKQPPKQGVPATSNPANRPVSGVEAGRGQGQPALSSRVRSAPMQTAGCGSAGAQQQCSTARGSRPASSSPGSYMRMPAGCRETGSGALAAERAARAAAGEDIALVRSLQ